MKINYKYNDLTEDGLDARLLPTHDITRQTHTDIHVCSGNQPERLQTLHATTSIACAVSLHPQTVPPWLCAARDLVWTVMLHVRQTMGSNLGAELDYFLLVHHNYT
jgi:hypothetical protein